MWIELQIVLCVTVLINQNDGAKILAVYPTPSISHQVVYRPLTLELVKRGHDVTVITTDPIFSKGGAPKNLTEIDLHDISYQSWRNEFVSTGITQGNKKDSISQIETMMKVAMKIFAKQIADNEVQKIINDKSQKFDLLILEACAMPAIVYSHIFKAPVIQISSFGTVLDTSDIMGAPRHPILHPFPLAQKIHNHSFWDKLAEIYLRFNMDSMVSKQNVKLTNACRKILGPDVPDFSELKNNVDMVFLNVHSIWEMNRPSPPNMIYLGGLHQNPEKELPKDLQTYLDSSKNGVIYISFGTNVEPSLLPPRKIQALINVFSKLPYDVLWKWNQDELPGRTENIKILKWLPQSDLLRHPNVKLFVTQAGLQSTDEAIAAGVPLVALPMLGDQWYNAELYEYHGIGVQLDLETIDEEQFNDAIQKVANNDSYRQNILRLRSIMHDQPETPIERAIWWTEYVLRHGGAKHLRSPAANISWTQYLELELVFYLLAIVTSVISLLVFIVYRLISRNKIKVKVKSF